MAAVDLSKELDELHATVVTELKRRIEDPVDAEGNPKAPEAEDLRLALQLLKQNGVTSQLSEDDQRKLRGRMAAKLDFSALQGKVVPISGSGSAAG